MLNVLRRVYVCAALYLCSALDHIPGYDDGHWYRMGDWGCLWNISFHAARLDERWATGVFREVAGA